MNKDICVKCVNENDPKNLWGVTDEYRWRTGRVMCPVSNHFTFWDVDNIEPPKWCFYDMEQILLSQGHIKK